MFGSIFKTTTTRRALTSLGLSAIVGLAMSGTARAASCSSEITSCGCSITSPGYYQVTANLTNKGSGVCIDIQAKNTVLEFGNGLGRPLTMTGRGSGTGIWIENSATYTVVSGIKNRQNLPTGLLGSLPPVPVVINEASITGFTYAIEDDADNTVIGYFNKLNNNNSAVYLNGATNVTAGNFCADFNKVAGVLAVNTNNSRIYDFTAEQNTLDGLVLANSNNNVLYNLTTAYNAQDGILLQDSSNNSLSPGSSGQNGSTGIHIGCGSIPSISCSNTSNSNHLVGNTVEGLFTGDVSNCDRAPGGRTPQPVGIYIESGNSMNIIASNKSTNNFALRGPSFDLQDDNPNCDANVWTNNVFTNIGRITPLCTGNP